MRTRCYVGVGSNIAPERMIPEALARLDREVGLVAVSRFHRTGALGAAGQAPQPDFLNGVVALDSELPPRRLKLDVLRGIEASLGRDRGPDRYAPRTIDLDLLLYGELVCDEPDLVLPDPDITRRIFVAEPLLELAPGLLLPGSGRALADVVAQLRMSGAVLPVEDSLRMKW